MKEGMYGFPIFEYGDKANLKLYSEKMESAMKTQVDKFGNPLVFKKVVDNLQDLNNIVGMQKGEIYGVLEENKNYVWDGTNWEKYSDILDLSNYVMAKDLLAILTGTNITAQTIKRNRKNKKTVWKNRRIWNWRKEFKQFVCNWMRS